ALEALAGARVVCAAVAQVDAVVHRRVGETADLRPRLVDKAEERAEAHRGEEGIAVPAAQAAGGRAPGRGIPRQVAEHVGAAVEGAPQRRARVVAEVVEAAAGAARGAAAGLAEVEGELRHGPTVARAG